MAVTATITKVHGAMGAVVVTMTVTDGTVSVQFPFVFDPSVTPAQVLAEIRANRAMVVATLQGVANLTPHVGTVIT